MVKELGYNELKQWMRQVSEENSLRAHYTAPYTDEEINKYRQGMEEGMRQMIDLLKRHNYIVINYDK